MLAETVFLLPGTHQEGAGPRKGTGFLLGPTPKSHLAGKTLSFVGSMLLSTQGGGKLKVSLQWHEDQRSQSVGKGQETVSSAEWQAKKKKLWCINKGWGWFSINMSGE